MSPTQAPLAAPGIGSVPGADVAASPEVGSTAGTRVPDSRPLEENGSLSVVALNAVVSRIETVEQEIRAAEAERLRLFAEAFAIAAADNQNDTTLVPSGANGELAYRAVRAELATALHQSERTIERHLAHAHTLTHEYPRVFEAYRDGRLSAPHTTVITQAGVVIGSQDDPDTVSRRAAYEESVLAVALAETPGRLRPLAQQLAEQYATVPLDERHAQARRRRRVWVQDAEDGMADLIAHLPAGEAYAIWDRVTRMGRVVARVEAENDSSSAENGAVGVDARVSTAGPSDRKTGTDPASPPPSSARRSRDEIRADLLTDLLLTTGLHGADALRPEPVSTGQDSTAAPARPAARSDAAGPRFPGGIAAIRAHVQVVIPSLTLPTGTDGTGTAERAGPPEQTVSRNNPGSTSGSDPTVGHDPPTDTAPDPGFDSLTGSDPPPGFDSPADYSTEIGSPTAPAPPLLAGYGPIDTDTARRLAGHATHWERIRTTPDGNVLSVDRYRPSEAIRRHLRARDQHCRFPACRMPISRCDLDHTVDAALGGPTTTQNLSHLCRGHHTLKHHTAWRVRQHGDGDLTWTSPTGRVHHDRAPSRVMFRTVTSSPPPAPF